MEPAVPAETQTSALVKEAGSGGQVNSGKAPASNGSTPLQREAPSSDIQFDDLAMQVLHGNAPVSMVTSVKQGLKLISESVDGIKRQSVIAEKGLDYMGSRGSECSMLDLYMIQHTVNGGVVLIKKHEDVAKEAFMFVKDVV